MDRFQKLYSDFKSERFGWRMVLMARKLMLVSTTVMFNQLPLFQVGVRVRVRVRVLHGHVLLSVS